MNAIVHESFVIVKKNFRKIVETAKISKPEINLISGSHVCL